MSIRTFLKLVEINTKLASLFPFLIGSLFVLYYFGKFNVLNTLIFFCSMLIFDLTTTAINNYMDYKKATTDAYRREHNIIGQRNVPESYVVGTIFTMLAIAIGLGIWLVFLTDIFVLFIGLACFAVGICYTFGPIPISRMPLGEVFAGLTMGFGIVLLIVYVNAFDQGILSFMTQGSVMVLQIDMLLLAHIAIVSLPCVFTIAAVMLANNICDLEDDIKNKRFTLPYYLGKGRSIKLFNTLYISTFIAILSAIYLNLMPVLALLAFIVILPVYRNTRHFNEKQTKSETFPLAVKNLVLVNGAIVMVLGVSLII